jgi:pyruvate dehydrogenase E1 component alpha subunit
MARATKPAAAKKASTKSRAAKSGAKRSAKAAPAAKSSAKSGKTSAKAPAKAELLELYRNMLLIRRFEEKAGQLYGQGLIAGFCHLYIGQEAVVVGMQANLTPDDTVVTTYRDHGHMLACGMDPKGVMAELTGRRGGYSHGKGGSMHMFSKEKNFYGGHGIVGASVPVGAGLAFAHRYRGNDCVSLTYYGDGAANQGQVMESFNMAALWKLPCIFIIENNQYGMGTSVARASASAEFYKRGEPFGIPGQKVDGMDVQAVREAGAEAVAHCRAGKGPFILQMETYRYRGHSMSDPARYRTRDEVQKVREERDPIDHLSDFLFANNMVKADDLKKIDAEVKKIVTAAAEFATTDSEPAPEELYTDVLVEA